MQQKIFNTFIIIHCSVIKITAHISGLLLVILHLYDVTAAFEPIRWRLHCSQTGQYHHVKLSVPPATLSVIYQWSFRILFPELWQSTFFLPQTNRCRTTSRSSRMCGGILMTLHWLIMKLLNVFCPLWTVPADHRLMLTSSQELVVMRTRL